MSCRWGKLPIITGPSATRLAHNIGRAAFRATHPHFSVHDPLPLMINLSIRKTITVRFPVQFSIARVLGFDTNGMQSTRCNFII